MIVNGLPVLGPSEFPTGPRGPQAPESDIGFFDAISGPAWRRHNMVANIANGAIATPEEVEASERIDVWSDIEGTEYEPWFDSFAPLTTRVEVDRMKAKIDQEQDDKRVLDEAGLGGFAAEAVATVVDLPSLFPAGAAVGAARGGMGVLRTGARTAGVAGAEATAVEGFLQTQQETRSGAESAFTIGGSVVLGALLGSGLSAVLGRSVEGRQAFQQASQTVQQAPDRFAGSPEDLSAAARVMPEITDFDLVSPSAQRILDATPAGLSYTDRFAKSRSAVARKIGTELLGNEYAFAGQERLQLQPAVERFAGVTEDRARIKIAQVFKEDYKAFRKQAEKTGLPPLKAHEFGERIARAMRRGDVDPEYPAVTEAARKLRQDVIEPMKDDAIRMGLLPDGVTVDTAVSYFTRMWDAQRIIARSDEFLRRLSAKFSDDFANSPEGRALDKAEVDTFARSAAEDVYRTLTDPSASPTTHLNITVAARGPLKERTLNVRDVDFEDFLINDAEYVLNRYARVMPAETELARRFGRPDMKDQIDEINQDFDKLRDAAGSDKERRAIETNRRKTIRALEAARDHVRGTYMAEARASAPYRVMQGAMTYKFTTALGHVVASSIPDLGKVTMVNGMMPVVRDALVPLVNSTSRMRLRASQKEIAAAAGIAEPLLNNRMLRIADITDPYAQRTPVENALHWLGSKSSLFSGIMHWNQFLKEMASYMATRRLARMNPNNLTKRDERFLGRVKLTKANLHKVQQQLRAHGEELDGVFVPNIERWDDPDAERIFSTVIRSDADSTIVTPGIGDKIPLVEEHWYLKPAMQFKSFALASHRKTLMVGMQEDQARFFTNAALMVSLGMFVYYLKSMGQTDGKPSDNPGVWLAEGIDRSGLVPIYMEVNNMAERVGAPGVYYGLGSVFGETPERASRFQARGIAQSVVGPVYGTLTDAATMTNALMSGEVTPGDIGAGRRMIPFGNHPGIKEYLNRWVVPELKESVAD